MQVIFESLRFLLQPDASGEDLDSPQDRADVLDALRELDDRPAILASRGFYEDSDGVFLVSVLERYSLLLLRSHERGEPERVQQFLYSTCYSGRKSRWARLQGITTKLSCGHAGTGACFRIPADPDQHPSAAPCGKSRRV
jgi:hypothetical protein